MLPRRNITDYFQVKQKHSVFFGHNMQFCIKEEKPKSFPSNEIYKNSFLLLNHQLLGADSSVRFNDYCINP